jgi:hypothetical protein
MVAAVRAGLIYFIAVFGLGFLLGTLRGWLVVHGVASRDTLAFIEVPIIVAYAWFASGLIARRMDVPARFLPRVVMGVAMLVALRISEAAVGLFLIGMGLLEQLVELGTLKGLLQFLPQVLTAAFPLIRLYAARGDAPGTTP